MSEFLTSELPLVLIERTVRIALLEDLGDAGDITTNSTIPTDATAFAVLAAREDGILSGMALAQTAFSMMDKTVDFKLLVGDSSKINAGTKVAQISGNARSILSVERVALNFLMRMSGISTYTARFQDKISHTKAKICDTRKTIAGHRAFDKYAVKCGGGSNHRFGFYDAVLIKDNHIAVAGGIALAIDRARAYAGHLVMVEVEVDNLDQFREALDAKPDSILLDNMSPKDIAEAVKINNIRDGDGVKLEASGNVSINTIKVIAETGVDYISTSKITMASPTLDLGLDIVINEV